MYVCICLVARKINMFSEIKVFKCFLCVCRANDAGRKATGGPQQELVAKQLVRNILIYIPKIYDNYI